MKIITETEKLKLGFENEFSFLIAKETNEILFQDEFYGNPNCGIIDAENNWVLIGGIHLTLWKPKKTEKYLSEDFKWIHSLRLKNSEIVEILIDPWNKYSAIWELNIKTYRLTKIKNFTNYLDKEYTESIEW